MAVYIDTAFIEGDWGKLRDKLVSRERAPHNI